MKKRKTTTMMMTTTTTTMLMWMMTTRMRTMQTWSTPRVQKPSGLLLLRAAVLHHWARGGACHTARHASSDLPFLSSLSSSSCCCSSSSSSLDHSCVFYDYGRRYHVVGHHRHPARIAWRRDPHSSERTLPDGSPWAGRDRSREKNRDGAGAVRRRREVHPILHDARAMPSQHEAAFRGEHLLMIGIFPRLSPGTDAPQPGFAKVPLPL